MGTLGYVVSMDDGPPDSVNNVYDSIFNIEGLKSIPFLSLLAYRVYHITNMSAQSQRIPRDDNEAVAPLL